MFRNALTATGAQRSSTAGRVTTENWEIALVVIAALLVAAGIPVFVQLRRGPPEG